MRNSLRLLATLLLVFLSISAEIKAQQELVLRKSYKPKTLSRIKVGDQIMFSTENVKKREIRTITGMTDSTISFNDETIGVSAITVIYLERNGFLLQGGGAGLQVFAIYHVAYGNLNAAIADAWTKEHFKRNLLFGTILFTVGTGLRGVYRITKYKSCRIGKFCLTYFSY